MRTLFTFSIVLASCVALFVFAPHHRRRGELFRPCTLAEIYCDLFSKMPPRVTPERAVFALLAVTGLVTCLYPPVLVLMVRFLRAGQQHRAGGGIFVLAGLIALAGAAANFIAMLVSHMTFGFGVSDSSSR